MLPSSMAMLADAKGFLMPRTHRSVRVDPDLLDRLEEAARNRLVPASFSEQVEAGLRLLLRQADETRTRRAARLVAADHDRAETTYQQLRRRGER